MICGAILATGGAANVRLPLTAGRVANVRLPLTTGSVANVQLPLTAGRVANVRLPLTTARVANVRLPLTAGRGGAGDQCVVGQCGGTRPIHLNHKQHGEHTRSISGTHTERIRST